MNKEMMIAAGVLLMIVLLAIFDGSEMPKFGSGASARATSGSSTASVSSPTKSCYHNGIELKGKVQIVDSFPDLKVEYVSSFSDIDVQFVSSFPSSCGQWQIVDSFPDFKIQVVSSFGDIKVKKVSSFPGMK